MIYHGDQEQARRMTVQNGNAAELYQEDEALEPAEFHAQGGAGRDG